jgi:hypothetical protein
MSATGHALRIARVDVTRMVRKRTAEWTLGSVVGVLMFGLVALLATVGGAWGGRAVGRALASGSLEFDPAGAASAARGLIGVFWVIGVAIFALRSVGQRGTLTNAEGILTVVPTREAYVGIVLAEYAYLLLWTLVPATGVGVGLALGSETLWPALGLPLLVLCGGLTLSATGYLVGLGVRHVITRFPFVARHKSGLVVLAFVVYFVAIFTGGLNQVVVNLFDPVAASPLGWYGDLATLGLPGVGTTATYAVGAVGVTVVLTSFVTLAGIRVAEQHWFADPALAGEDDADSDPTSAEGTVAGEVDSHARETPDRLGVALEGVLSRPTAALVTLAWRRAIRAPLKLLYAAYPLLFLVGVVADIFQTGQVPAYLPYGLVVFVAWAAGVVFTLNPLGDQGSVLPATVLSAVTGRRFVAAHVLAGLVVAVPVGTALVAATGFLSPLAPERVALLVAAAPVAMVVASALSVGIGTAFPRFEATNVTRSMEAVVPSPWAFVLFSLHLVLTAAAVGIVAESAVRSLAASLLSLLLSTVLSGFTLSPDRLYVVCVGLLVVLLVLPPLSYRYAVRTFDEYVLA